MCGMEWEGDGMGGGRWGRGRMNVHVCVCVCVSECVVWTFSIWAWRVVLVQQLTLTQSTHLVMYEEFGELWAQKSIWVPLLCLSSSKQWFIDGTFLFLLSFSFFFFLFISYSLFSPLYVILLLFTYVIITTTTTTTTTTIIITISSIRTLVSCIMQCI